MSVNHCARSGGITGISFRFFYVWCVFSLELPYRGDSNEYNIEKESAKIIPNLQLLVFFSRDSTTSSKEQW